MEDAGRAGGRKDWFQKGCFVRICWWPEDEVTTLGQRERVAEGKRSVPVPPSEVTYVRERLAVLLRGTEMGYEDCTQISYETHDLGDGFGMFLAHSDPVEWFFTGEGGKSGPDDTKWVAGQRYDNGRGSHCQLWNAGPDAIDEALVKLQKPGELLPVNEALLGFRVKDVVGLLLNPKSVKSIARAAGFMHGVLKHHLNRTVDYFSYDAKTGTILKEDLEELKQFSHCKSFNRKFKDYASFYETIWDKETM